MKKRMIFLIKHVIKKNTFRAFFLFFLFFSFLFICSFVLVCSYKFDALFFCFSI